MGAGSYVGTSVGQYLSQWPDSFCVDTTDAKACDWKSADFSKYDCVFHVAGLAHIHSRKEAKKNRQMFYEVNTALAVECAQKAKSQGVKQFIFMSTANVYGESAPIGKSKVITKGTPIQLVNAYGDSKFKAESEISELSSEEFKTVILRCPMIYGKGCRGNYQTLSKLALKLPFFPKVKNERSMLYIGNLAEFLRLMIVNEESGLFCPCDRETFCTSELVKMISEVHGKKITLVRGLGGGLKLLGYVFPMVSKAFGSFSYDPALGEYKEEYRLYTLAEGVKETEL